MKCIYIPNDRKPVVGSIRLIKLDRCNPNKALADAVFALYLWSEHLREYELLMDGLSTGTDGMLVIEGLPVGRYKLVETASPPAYLRDTNEFVVEIGVDHTGTIIEPEQIVVYNEAMPSCCCNCCCCCDCCDCHCCCYCHCEYCCDRRCECCCDHRCECCCDRRYYCHYCGCYHYYED